MRRLERAVGFKYFALSFEVKFWIAAHKLGEFGEGTSKAQFVDDRLHLGADAFDLFQADLVNLLRRKIGGGVIARRVGVHRRAIEHFSYADLIPCRRQVVANDKFF